MPAPININEFLDLVRKSGVVEEKRLDAHLEQLRAAGTLPTEPGKLAGYMVRDGLLTNFQVEQLLLGKWRRFTIGKYKVLERLGAGGMGSVYLCEHKFMRRRVAVKVLPAAKAEDPSALERFYREARAVAALDHPNIVRAYDIDQEDKLHFLVMEYVDGSSLQDIIKKCGPMDVVRSAHYIRQAAVGLQHAHEAGLVHRDIKPGNLLIDRHGVVKVLDMGLARFFNDEADDLTKKHDENVLGTADYLAPEQALDSHGVDIRADIYSLGATFYFLLTGNTPFNEGTVAQKLIWHQTRQPKPVRAVRPDVPTEVEAIILKMMAKDPAQRYQTPGEVMEALASLTQTPISPPPAEEMPQLCVAALIAGQGETTTALPALSPAEIPPTPVPRRTGPPTPPRGSRPPSGFQAGAPAPRNATAGIVAQPGSRPPSSRTVGKGGATAVPEVMPAGDDDGSPAWARLASDTADPSARADTSPRSSRGGVGRTSPAPAVSLLARPWRWFWLLSALVIVLVVAAVGAYMLYLMAQVWFNDPTVKALPAVERRPLIVSQAQGAGAFRSLQDAVAQSRPGDTIIVMDALVRGPFPTLDAQHKELTIQAGPQGTEWEFPAGQQPDVPLVSVRQAEAVKLHGFQFNGMNRAQTLVTISGACPGLTLEDVQLRNFTGRAILVSNCKGEDGGRVTLRRLRTVATGEAEAAVVLDLNEKFTAVKVNANLTLTECRFEGPYKAGVLVKGPVDKVEITRNRFFKCDDGILIKKGPALRKVGVTVAGNAFYDIKNGCVRLEDLPAANSNSQVSVTNNLFARAGHTVSVDLPESGELDRGRVGALFANQRNNVRTMGTQQGNLFEIPEVAGVRFLSTNPADAHFLVSDPNGPLPRGPEGPVGVAP